MKNRSGLDRPKINAERQGHTNIKSYITIIYI